MNVEDYFEEDKIEMPIEKTAKKFGNINAHISYLAQRKGMTLIEFEEWSERECERWDISEEEAAIIRAYKINQAIQQLKIEGKDRLASELVRDNWWIKRFTDDKEARQAIKHLEEVVIRHNNEGEKYGWEVLLDLDEIILESFKKKSKFDRND